MKHRSKLFAAIWLLCLVLGGTRCWGSQLVRSWKVVEDELRPAGGVLKDPVPDHWTNSATLRRFVADGNTNALIELASQPQSTLAGVSAYLALRRLDRDAAQEVGLKMVLTTNPFSNSIVDIILQSLISDLPNPSFKRSLSNVSRVGPVDPVNAWTLVRFLPQKVLFEWFEDKERPRSLPTFEALVLNRLYAERLNTKLAPTERMARTLEGYAAIPGEPRITYLAWTGETNAMFAEALRFCLQDESIPAVRLVGLLFQRAEFIQKHIDLKSLNISEARLAAFTNNLAQALKLRRTRK